MSTATTKSIPSPIPTPTDTDPTTGDAVGMPPEWALAALSPDSRACIANLVAYTTPPLPDSGLIRQAAVLVALFQRPGEDTLRVLLTTRAKTLRRHPSQTALPGGKTDPEDPSPVHTARREAYEEVGLPPLPHSHVHHLNVLDPVLTILPLNAHIRNHIVVTPVVCFVSDPALIDNLVRNPDEVDAIFDHPLRGVHLGSLDRSDGLVEHGGEWWPFPEEYYSTEDRTGVTGGYRMHRFRSSNSPIKGLTSDVLINTASIAYGSSPAYGRFAPHQPEFSTAIASVVAGLPGLSEVSVGATSRQGVLEWGGTEPGVVIKSTETYDMQ